MGDGTFQQARGYYGGGDGGELQEWYGTSLTSETPYTGFRLAAIPEPATMILIAVGVPFLLKRSRR